MLALKIDLRPAQKALGDLTGKQIPFASALALTTLAGGVQDAEVAAETKTFAKATPFTLRAFGKFPATKRNLVATVFIKDKTTDAGGQNAYLAPYVIGGDRSLGGKKGMLVPVGANVNAYGNLTKGTLARLKGKPNIFIGPVKTKRGIVNGVWQRPVQAKARGKRGSKAVQSQGHMKLLIEFEDTTPVREHLDFYGVAIAYVGKHAQPVFEDALRTAMASARK
jgi:hypothetical protein